MPQMLVYSTCSALVAATPMRKTLHAVLHCLRGDNDIMVALLGVMEGNQTDLMDYALILACRKGHLAVVETMLEHGGQVKDMQHATVVFVSFCFFFSGCS